MSFQFLIKVLGISLFLFCNDYLLGQNSSFEYNSANAFNITLKEVSVLDTQRSMGTRPFWNVIFLEDKNQMIYVESTSPSSIVIRNYKTLELVTKFRGSNVHLLSPDGNRIFYDKNIYDIKQKKSYKLDVNFFDHYRWNSGTQIWLDDDKIVSYKNYEYNGRTTPDNEYYYYLDLNDLRIKKLPDDSIKETFNRIMYKLKKERHRKFYLYNNNRGFYIHDKNTPYVKSLIYNPPGYPISGFWATKNLEYVAIKKYSQVYSNKDELVLYKLEPTIKSTDLDLFFTASSPSKWLDKEFKTVFDQTNGVGIWADVYEKKINPLNNKILGPDKSTFKGSVKIVKDLGNNKIGVQVGYHKNDIKSDYIVAPYHKHNNFIYKYFTSKKGDS